MLRFWRIGGTVLGLLAAVWLLRAVYLYRVWAMASLWYGPTPPEPSFLSCLSPQMSATTAHGVFADTAFLKIPIRANEIVDIQGQESVPLPLPPFDASACRTPAMRYDPHNMPVENYAPCLRSASWFAIYAAQKGEAYRINADIHKSTETKGGFVLRDDEHHYVYLAAYRTYRLDIK